MFNFEKVNRCEAAELLPHGCRVYSRVVKDCRDCAFSIVARPHYIRTYRMGPVEYVEYMRSLDIASEGE